MFFKTAFRNLWRYKNFTFINMAGLGVGIAVCLLIFLVIQFELSFDQHHKNKDNIYRVLTQFNGPEGTSHSAGVPYPLPTAFKNDFPDIISTPVIAPGDDQIIVLNESGNPVKKFREETGLFFSTSNLFSIFDFKVLAGDIKSLDEPNTAFLSKETAERYYDSWQSAIGKTFKRNNDQLYKITGIIENPPVTSDLQVKIITSYITRKNFVSSTDWRSVSSNHGVYVLLPKNKTPEKVNADLVAFTKKYKTGEEQKNIQILQSLAEVHFDDETGNFLQRTISKSLISTLWLIAIFILVIACVNFINLSTAQAINRAKEIGVRKVLGSNRSQLQLHFFTETAVLTFAATVLAVLIAAVAMKGVAAILELPITFSLFSHPSILLFLLITFSGVVLLAGFYPAIVMSRFNPITALKSKAAAKSTRGISLRRGLVVLQFVIAQVLIIGTLIIVKQMEYFRSKSLGFSKNAIVNFSFPADSAGRSKLDFLKTEARAIKGVQQVSFSFASPADNGNWYSDFRFGNQEKATDFGANLKWADADYINTYDLQLLHGRNIQPSDTIREFIVNETLLSKLGITDMQSVINTEITMWDRYRGSIVGVVKDFHANSLREAVPPVIISTFRETYGTAGIKFNTENLDDALKSVQGLWAKTFPDHVYEQEFLDAKIENFYRRESQLSQLYKIFAGIAIFLSCLGLYGLASFMAVQKVKEVGIRKVLGASVKNIFMLFSREFIFLIAIAFVVAAPIAWYYMDKWLEDFSYRISIPWWILLLAGMIAVFIALVTISFQAIRAAVANPVKSLRTE